MTTTMEPTTETVVTGTVRPRSTYRRRRATSKVLIYLGAVLFAGFSILPVLWGLSTALKEPSDIYALPPQWVPEHLTFDNFIGAMQNEVLIRSFFNTFIIAVGTTLIALVIGVLGAYGFSRFKFPGQKTLLWTVLFTQLFPRVVVLVPYFITLRNLDLLNTYQGLILVYLMAVFPVAIWLIKGFFDAIPIEIEEAAVLDGCSVPRMLWQIILPISKPALAAVAMYSFILAWNEYLFALVFTNGLDRRPIAVALAFFIDENGVRWGELTAASLLMSIPSIVVFALTQKLLVRGLSEGAVKG